GGTSLGCLVALAAIEYLERNDLPARALSMGKRFMEGLTGIREAYPDLIVAVRGKGLMLGVEFPEDSIGPRMVYQLRKNGVITIYTFNNPRIIRIMPTLVISEQEVDFVLDALNRSLRQIRAQEQHFENGRRS
ncbi:MAG: aminotransferase class III-fold pyridoxal phosphate-dependent enzyme, partial [Deltaproteobacteria bacterium]